MAPPCHTCYEGSAFYTVAAQDVSPARRVNTPKRTGGGATPACVTRRSHVTSTALTTQDTSTLNYVLDNFAVDIGKPELPTLIGVSQPFMIKPHQMKYGGLQIVDMHRFVNNMKT